MVQIRSQVLSVAKLDIAALNRAALGRSVVVGRPKTSDFRDCLLTDANGRALVRRYGVADGILSLRIRLEDGSYMQRIRSLSDLKYLDVIVEEEVFSNGDAFKVLYGCGIRENGTLRMIRCIMSEKKLGDKKWRLKRAPLYLEGLSRNQEMKRNAKLIAAAVENGLGNEELLLWWHVNHKNNKNEKKSFVRYKYGNIYGFNEMNDRVLCRIFEAKGMVVARFYRGSLLRDSEDSVYKVAILSEFVAGKRTPLKPPKVTYNQVGVGVQAERMFIRKLERFLLERNSARILEIGPREPVAGVVRFNINCNDLENGGVILCNGYSGYDVVYGLAARINGEKKAWFWPDPALVDLRNVAGAIIPEGHVIGRKADGKNSGWRIVWGVTDGEFRRLSQQTTIYGNKILSDSSEIIFSVWKVMEQNSSGRTLKILERTIRGTKCRIRMPDNVGDEVISATIRIGNGRFRLVQFWEDKADYDNGKPEIAVGIIAFRRGKINEKADWMVFCARLDEVKKFQGLMNGGIGLSKDELEEALFSDGYLRMHYDEQLKKLSKSLFPLGSYSITN